MNDLSFTFRTLSLSIRPGRTVVFLKGDDPDWEDTILRIIEWYSNCWGGSYGLIVPTDGNKIDEEFWRIMEIYDPDYIYCYQKTLLDLKIADPEEYDKRRELFMNSVRKSNPNSDLTSYSKLIDENPDKIKLEPCIISTELINELKKRLNPFYWDELFCHEIDARSHPGESLTTLSTALKGMETQQEILSPKIEASTELKLCLHSSIGKINDKLREDDKSFGETSETDAYNILQKSWNAENIHELIEIVLDKKKEYRMMPYPSTLVGLSQYTRKMEIGLPLLILGDTMKEFCLYYNLSRLRHNVYWLPLKVLQFSLEEKSIKGYKASFEGESSYLFQLRDVIQNVARRSAEKKYAVFSLSCPEQVALLQKTIDESVISVNDKPMTGALALEIKVDIDELLKNMVRLYEEGMPLKIYVEQFHDGQSINFLNTPIPKKFPKIPPYGHYWITDVRIEGYMPPKMRSFGPKSIIQKNYGNEHIRMSSEGFSYFCPFLGYFHGWGGIENILVRPKLRIYDDFTLIEELFRESGYHIKYSDKGNFQREACAKFGSLNDLTDFLLKDDNRALLAKYLDEKMNKEGKEENEGVWLSSEKRRYLCFSDVQKIITSDTRTVLDYLLEKKILYRGFIFYCQKCRNSAWYPIEEVSSTFLCSRCGTSQLYKKEHWKQPEEPTWFYKLDEVVNQGLKHNMHIPVFAVRYLKKLSNDAFHYIPEIELRRDPLSEKPDLEIDVVAIVDGEVFLGEGTKDNKLEKSDAKEKARLAKLRDVAASVHAKRLVLTTFSDTWSETTKKNVGDAFRGTYCAPLFLNKEELLS